ncbi:protein YIPF [Elysia marginata]|uniref:Protein YIPF n=1 Tax=Elysia marginata TaxID=1093978 RepID=A0AAV4JV84_9GAST|nr:protein YIPF [Elysia marginata]
MASSTTIDVDGFGNDIKEDGMESLDFQDIPHDAPDSPEKGQTTHFTRFPHSAADSDDEADDKEKLIKEEKSGTSSFWTFAYYQQFFDVETAQVGQRIVGSMLPKPGSNYLVHQIRPNPDLYGPFWICTTLVFTTAIAGNLANYFSMAGKAYHWQYDFHKVTLAATAIFSYWWLIPLLLWAVLWWRGSQAKFSFLEMLCVYGYSLAIYVPISILWAIQVSWLQWTLVVVGAALSGSVLLLTFWPAIKEDSQKIAIGLMVFIFIMHAALAAGFVLYFFYVPASPSTHVTPLPIPANKTVPVKGININSQSQPAQVQNKPVAGPVAQASAGASGVVAAPLGEVNNVQNPIQARTPQIGQGNSLAGQAVVNLPNKDRLSQQQGPFQSGNLVEEQARGSQGVALQKAQPQQANLASSRGQAQGSLSQGTGLKKRGQAGQQEGNTQRRSLAGKNRIKKQE